METREIPTGIVGIGIAIIAIVMILTIVSSINDSVAFTDNAITEYFLTSTTGTLTYDSEENTETLQEYNNTWLNFTRNENLTIPDHAQYSPASFNNETTISFWLYMNDFVFKGQSTDDEYTNFFRKSEGNQNEWIFRIENATGNDSYYRPCRISFYAFNISGGEGAGSYFQDNSTINTCPTLNNTWIHVVGRINGTHTAIFKNGVLRDSDALSEYGIRLQDTTASLRIGNDDDSLTGTWDGSIDDIRIYNRSLSNTEIAALYAEGRRTNSTFATLGLVGHWKFNENTGVKGYDISRYRNNATLTTGVKYANDAKLITLTDLTDYTLSYKVLTIVDHRHDWNYLTLAYTYHTLTTQKEAIEESITGYGSFTDYVAIIVIAIVASIAIGVILSTLKRRR